MRRLPKQIYKETAKDFNVKNEIVKDIVNYCYDELRKYIGHEDEPYLLFTGLGFFKIRLSKLKKRIIQANDNVYYNNFSEKPLEIAIYERESENIIRYTNMRAKIMSESERKYNVRKEYYERINKENKKDNK